MVLSHSHRVLFLFAAATLVGFFVRVSRGRDAATAYCTGYLLELSLSVDNLLAFLVIFKLFKVAPENQGRVLQWGLVGAALLRGVCIAAGAAVLQRFRPALLLCALLLAFSSYKLLYMGDDDDEVGEGRVARLVRRVLPLSEAFDGDRFFTTGKGGRRLATPLMLVLFVIEGTDLVFAVDSIPAVFGVSNDPEIVWLSSFMAILGLRTIYTLLAEKISDSQEEISKPVAALLLFISLKIVLEFAGIAINPWVSLSVVLFLVGLGALRVARPSKKRIMGPSKVVVE